MSKLIYIDAGHGGNSIGASYKGRLEQDDTLKLALAVGKLVQAQGVSVAYSRTGNTNPELGYRAKQANDKGANYFISIHRNAFKPNQANGVEAWVYSKCSKTGKTYKAAETIVKNVAEASGFSNRGVKLGAPSYSDYAVNKYTNMDSCLLECGFIDSDKDNNLFDKKFDAIAQAIAKGLCAAVGVTYKAPVSKPVAKEKYIVQVGAFSEKKNAEAMVEDLKKKGINAIIKEV